MVGRLNSFQFLICKVWVTIKWKCQEDRHIYLEIKAKESLDEHVDLAIIGINRNWNFRNIKE